MELSRDFDFGDGRVHVEIDGDDVTLTLTAEDGATAWAKGTKGDLETLAAMLDELDYGMIPGTREERRAGGIEDD